MQSKKGIYLLVGLISTVLIFFFILFFVHENTLENGILFTVSFEYQNAKEISYNFYNQSGKIEKIEGENHFLLEKTDYNSVKLLRRITKKLKESKTPWEEEGISIYNGQNKRYYLIPYNSDAAKELSSLIIDGYIHSEMKRTTNDEQPQEIYLYKDEKNSLNWTNDGSTSNIIHTYSCQNEKCKYITIENDRMETILQDDKYYYYNYNTKTKEEINIDFDLKNGRLIKEKETVIGLELQNEKGLNTFYDLKTKECITSLENYHYSNINEEMILKQKKTTKDNKTIYELIVFDKTEKTNKWKKEMEDKNDMIWNIRKSELKDQEIYFLKREEQNKVSYYVLDSHGNTLLNSQRIELDESGKIMLYEKDIIKNGEEHYHVYDSDGNFLETLSMSYASDAE